MPGENTVRSVLHERYGETAGDNEEDRGGVLLGIKWLTGQGGLAGLG
jgi:hypothetical protein